jgi:hypothetical protein
MDEQPSDHDRLIRIDAELGALAHETSERFERAERWMESLADQVRGTNTRLVALAFSIALSSIGIALTVLFTSGRLG